MNFFEHQEHARRQTKKHILLFAVAVIGIVCAVNVAMAGVWSLAYTQPLEPNFAATISLGTLAIIAGGTLLELYFLRDGGDAVAKMAGGRLVAPDTQDAQERRLLNVVAEMSLASAIACPKVYVLDREASINAFAAGYNPHQAVVAVTRGMIDRLNRDELQGVVAHEFSHILNGDMRLNVRLIAVLYGLQMVAVLGQLFMRAPSHTGSTGSDGLDVMLGFVRMLLFVSGLLIFIVGYIGVFAGRLIKAAVSRQREFLADASAVQFTRNPDGIGNALRKIGGVTGKAQPRSRIDHPNAEHLSHLFLAPVSASLMSGMLATHPTIVERLQRIYGRRVETLDTPPAHGANSEQGGMSQIAMAALPKLSGFAGSDAEADLPLAFSRPGENEAPLPAALQHALRETSGAAAVVYALLLGRGAARQAQHEVLGAVAPQQRDLVLALAGEVARLPRSARLPLLDLAMPTLGNLSSSERHRLLEIADLLIGADGRVVLGEFVLRTVLAMRLDQRAGRAIPVKFSQLVEVKPECAVLLSLVAHLTAPQSGLAAADAFAQMLGSRPGLPLAQEDLLPLDGLKFSVVQSALKRARCLAPLAKQQLMELLLAAVGNQGEMPVEIADLLRAICAALESPVPAAVAATYTAHAWASETVMA